MLKYYKKNCCQLNLGGCPLLGQVLRDSVHELERGQVSAGVGLVVAGDADTQVLGHVAGLDGLDADVLKALDKLGQLVVLVQLGAMSKAAGPGKDGGDRVRGGVAALLMDPVENHGFLEI